MVLRMIRLVSLLTGVVLLIYECEMRLQLLDGLWWQVVLGPEVWPETRQPVYVAEACLKVDISWLRVQRSGDPPQGPRIWRSDAAVFEPR